MSDRRRTTRYGVPEAAQASLLVMQDVYVERVAQGEIVVLADDPVPPSAELLLEVSGAVDTRRIAAVVAGSHVSLGAGRPAGHRVILAVSEAVPEGITLDSGHAVPSIGVLLRRMSVRVRDISTGGCLLDAANPLPDGAIGILELTFGGEQHTETLRVCRSTSTGDGWACRSGARFLALGAPPSTSVRNVVARFELMAELGSMPEALARVHERGSTSALTRHPVSWSAAIAQYSLDHE